MTTNTENNSLTTFCKATLPVAINRRRAVTADLLAAEYASAGNRGGDITGGGTRMTFGTTENDIARECMAAVLPHPSTHGWLENHSNGALATMAGLGKAARRRGQRRLIGGKDIAPPIMLTGRRAVAEFDTPVYESLADATAESSALESDGLQFCQATATALAHEKTIEGRIMAIAGGLDWQGGTQTVKTGQDRRLVSRVPSGGAVAFGVRYTIKRC